MFDKTTDELEHDLQWADAPEDYLNRNRRELISHSLAAELERLLVASGYSKAEAVRRSGLNRVYAYQIFSGDREPSRDKLLGLIFGMGLTLDKAQRLLMLAGHRALYARDARDALLMHALQKGRSILEANELLFNHGMAVVE